MIYLTVIPGHKRKKITQQIQSTVELMDDKLVMVSVCKADLQESDDESMPAVNQFLSVKTVVKRQFITGLTIQYYHDIDLWGVEIYVIGGAGCEPCFKEERQAIAFIDDLLEWSSKLSVYPHVN